MQLSHDEPFIFLPHVFGKCRTKMERNLKIKIFLIHRLGILKKFPINTVCYSSEYGDNTLVRLFQCLDSLCSGLCIPKINPNCIINSVPQWSPVHEGSGNIAQRRLTCSSPCSYKPSKLSLLVHKDDPHKLLLLYNIAFFFSGNHSVQYAGTVS